ncbi:MAG: phage tail protein [Ewingella sp.]
MLKADALRAQVMHRIPWLQENPDLLLVCVRKGNVVATGRESPSFEYRYKLELLVIDYPGDLDELTITILAWANKHQPDLLFHPDRRLNGIAFEADILSNDCADILFSMDTTDAVVVTKDCTGKLIAHPKDEPDYSAILGVEPGAWDAVFKGEIAA